jgi:hypothetical protein
MRVQWSPTFAPDHPSDEDLSPGTPAGAKMGHEKSVFFFGAHRGIRP